MNERGAVTIWGLGLIVVLFGFGGLAIDTWRVFAERQALAGVADSASNAGATAVDAMVFRDGGEVVLDRPEAEARARDYVARNGAALGGDFTVAIGFVDGGIEVVLEREVGLTLLGVFLSDNAIPMRVRAFALPGERSLP